MALVFSKGEWITVSLPPDGEAWSFSDQLLYGSIWAYVTREKHGDIEKANQIAEAFVFKRLYPGMVFSKELESIIQSLLFDEA